MPDDVLRLRATVISEEALANLRLLRREIGEVQKQGGRGAKDASASWTQLGKVIKSVGGDLAGAATGLTGLGAAGLGAAAGFGIVAAAGYKLVSGLGDLSEKIIKLNNDSKELGLSTQALKAFATEAQKAGIAPEAMMQGLSNFKRNTEDFGARIGELRGQMVAMGAGPVLARINGATTQLDKMKEAFKFKEVLQEADPSGMKARRFFEMIGLGADAARLSWDEFADTMSTKKMLSDEQIQAAKDYQKSLIALGDKWNELSTKVGIKLFPFVGKEIDDISKFIGMLDKIDDWVESWIGKGDPMAKAVGGINRTLGLDKFDPFGWKAQRQKEDEAEDKKRLDATTPGSKQRAQVEKEIKDRKEREGIAVAPVKPDAAVTALPQLIPAEQVKAQEEAAAAAKAKKERDDAAAARAAVMAAEGRSERQSVFTGPGVFVPQVPQQVAPQAPQVPQQAVPQVPQQTAPRIALPQAAPRVAPADLDRLLQQGDIKVTPEQFRLPGKQSALGGGATPATYSPGGGGVNDSDASRIVKIGVFDALVDFKSYIESGAAAGGAAGSGVGGVLRGGGGAGSAGSAGGGGGGAPSGASTGSGSAPSGASTGTESAPSGATTPPPTGTQSTATGGTGGDETGQNQTGDGGQPAARPGPGGQSNATPGDGGQGTTPNGNAPSGASTGTIPGRFANDVKGMMAAGAKPKDIQQYLSKKGVNVGIPTCGQFMAAVVRDHGGTPPKNPATASSWNNFGGKDGAGYSDDPNAINVAVKQGTTKADGSGSHVTAAVPIRDKDGKITGFEGVGVNQGRGGVGTATGQYGRNVITSNRIKIGTGKGEYQIRHQIVRPEDRPPGSQVATPNGQAPQGTQAQQPQTSEKGGKPDGSAIPRAGKDQSQTLAEQRKPYIDYLNAHPEVKERMAGLLVSEEPSREGRTGTAETFFNRMIAHGVKPEQMLTSKEGLASGKGVYYEPLGPGGTHAKSMQRLQNDAKLKEQTLADIDRAGGGSNVSEYGTQNASAGVAASAARTSTVTREARKGVSDQWSRKDRPEFAGLHGAGVTRKEREWYERTRAAVQAERSRNTNVATTAAPKGAKAEDRVDTSRIDNAVAPPAASGQVSVNVHSNGTKATTDTKTDGQLFQKPVVRQHKQMQRTEDAGETLSV